MTKRIAILLMLLGLASPAIFAQASQGNSNGGQGALHWMVDLADWLAKLWHDLDPPPPLNYVPGEIEWKVTCEGGVIVITGMYNTYPGVNKFDPNVAATSPVSPATKKKA